MYGAAGIDLGSVAVLVAIYPGVWGVAQLFTGALSDRVGRRGLIAAGMWLQAAAIAAVVLATSFGDYAVAAALQGLGTAMVYPTLLAAVADGVSPHKRATAVGTYRLWRDLGYVVGAFLAGVTADAFGMDAAVLVVAGLTFLSGALVALRASPQRAPDDLPSTLRP
jgi:MFS family permease